MTFLQFTANPFQQKFSLQANDLFINICFEKKNLSQKAMKGIVRKHLSSLRYLCAVLFLMRDKNVIDK